MRTPTDPNRKTRASEDVSIDQVLNSVEESAYGETYQTDVLTMYQNFVASAETVSDRRHSSNTFYLSICTGFLAVYSTLLIDGVEQAGGWYIRLSALGGIVFSLIWLGSISSYRALNSAKFAVIQQIERQLPLAPFRAEDWAYHRPGKKMVPFSKYESYMPWLFIAVYFVIYVAVSGDFPASDWLSSRLAMYVLLLLPLIGGASAGIVGFLKKRKQRGPTKPASQ